MTRLLPLLLAALALLAAGCGGGDDDDDSLSLLDTAVEKTGDAESYRHSSRIEGGGISMTADGTSLADSSRGRMTMTGDFGAGRQQIEAISIGDVMYLKGELGLPAGKEWLRVEDQTTPTSTLTPAEFVSFLRDSGAVESVGTEEVRGEPTTHYRGPLDVQRLAEETGPEAAERLRRVAGAENVEITVDVWLPPGGLPARISAEIRAPEDGSIRITSDILDYDVAVDAEEPPADLVADGG